MPLSRYADKEIQPLIYSGRTIELLCVRYRPGTNKTYVTSPKKSEGTDQACHVWFEQSLPPLCSKYGSWNKKVFITKVLIRQGRCQKMNLYHNAGGEFP